MNFISINVIEEEFALSFGILNPQLLITWIQNFDIQGGKPKISVVWEESHRFSILHLFVSLKVSLWFCFLFLNRLYESQKLNVFENDMRRIKEEYRKTSASKRENVFLEKYVLALFFTLNYLNMIPIFCVTWLLSADLCNNRAVNAISPAFMLKNLWIILKKAGVHQIWCLGNKIIAQAEHR